MAQSAFSTGDWQDQQKKQQPAAQPAQPSATQPPAQPAAAAIPPPAPSPAPQPQPASRTYYGQQPSAPPAAPPANPMQPPTSGNAMQAASGAQGHLASAASNAGPISWAQPAPQPPTMSPAPMPKEDDGAVRGLGMGSSGQDSSFTASEPNSLLGAHSNALYSPEPDGLVQPQTTYSSAMKERKYYGQ